MRPMPNSIYYIDADNEDGESLSLFVQAKDHLRAIFGWKEWLEERGEETLPDKFTVFKIPPVSDSLNPKPLTWDGDVKRFVIDPSK